MSQNDKIKFNPIQCTSEAFKTLSPREGFLYFVTDTKQLFLGKNNDFVNMCGGTNIHYGTKKIEYENSGQAPDPNVLFKTGDLESGENPLKDDLILNTDGCFYRVESVSEDNIATVRLTLQGSGGGNNSGGGDVTTAGYSINVTPQTNIFSSQSENMTIGFQAIAQQATDNYIQRLAFSLGGPESEDNPAFYVVDGYYSIGTLANPQIHPIDLIDYKHLFGASASTVYVNSQDVYGTNFSKKFSIQVVDLSLTPKEKIIFKSSEDNYSYRCNVGGAKTGITNKKIVISVYDEDNLNNPVIPPQEEEINSNFNGDKTCSLNLSQLSHGVYVVKVTMQAEITGSGHPIYSNTLTHKVIRFEAGSSENLLAASLEDSVEQYTNIPLYYMVASSEENKRYSIKIDIDAKPLPLLEVTTNTLTDYSLYFEEKGTYTITISVVEKSELSKSFQIQVKEYTGSLPYINPSDPNLILYMTPKGRTNDALDRNQWNEYNNRHIGQLTNMYYSKNSGWLEEPDGTSYLQLTSGGKLTIPTFFPFAEDPTRPSTTNSAIGNGITIELDFMVNGVTDYDAPLIQCLSHNQGDSIQVGFTITGNKIYFYNSSKNGGTAGSLVNMNLVEGKRIRLSFVIQPNNEDYDFPMCLTYLNGKISGAAIYSKKDSFVDSSTSPAQFIADSEHGEIKIYGIRFYLNALPDGDILNNFTASLPTLEERQKQFASNNIYNSDNEIDYEDISAENYDLQIPYMTIVGGWGCNKDDKWEMLPADQVGDAALPTGKKDYRMIDVSVVYPPYSPEKKDENGKVIEPAKNIYFQGYKNYSYKNIFENGLGMTDNFGNKPVNKTGCIMYAQGTSSMEYPVKNLRLRFRHKDHHFQVRPDLSPVEIICMKADYMESSGSHNTGAANLVDDLYAGASLKSPGQAHFGPNEDNPDRKEIVTCIKGHPCLIFWSPSGEKGTFKYIGKYNLNLDKATPEPFGFNHDDSDFGYLSPGDEYYAIQYDDDGKKFIGQEKPGDGGDYDDTEAGEEKLVVQEGQKINSIHCFEFLDNAIPVCNFLRKPKAYIEDENGNLIPDPSGGYYSYEDTWYKGFESEGDIVPGWSLGFESRYPEDRIGYHDADMLYPLASWLSELYYLKTEGSKGDGQPTQNDIDLANARFKNEYQAYFNKDFLLFYYIVTEALLMADSRVKNMMIATWGKEEEFSYYPLTYKETIKYVYAGTVNMGDWESGKTYYKLVDGEYVEASLEDDESTIIYTQTLVNSWEPDKTKEQEVTHYYKWYPIFYDMDTMLGLDNTGVNRFNYYDEDDDPSTYNGDEVLWNFVRDNLTLELDNMYNRLEPAGLNIDLNEKGEYSGTSVIPYFNNNQADMANEAFYNGDAQYKYIRPAISGYWDGLNNVQIEPGEAPYLYAAQGSRSLDREYFITNRLKFLRGKHNSEDFKTNDRITFRLYYPTGREANFKETVVNADGTSTIIDHSASVNADVAPPSDTFSFESLQTCYAGVLIGANGHLIKERFDGEQVKNIKVQEAQSANGTEAYLLGVSGLKDLGDLSNKYPQKFIMSGKNKLRNLTFGNAHKDYYNPFWRPEGGNSTPIGLSGCTYLQTFNMLNCKTYNAEINFSNCPIIETILLTGSSTSNLTLPVNGAIRELRLPTSINKLTINTHPHLTKENFSIGSYQYGTDNRIGGNGHYLNDYTQLTYLTIINTPIDSYDMVCGASNLEGYYFEGFNWDIEGEEKDNQYLPTLDATPQEGKTYYTWSVSDKAYIPATKEQFEANPTRMKEKYCLIENGEIIRIPILDYLYTKAPKKDEISVTRESALTGTITIKAPARVNQFDLYCKYNKKYPNVTINYDEDSIGSQNLIKAYTVEFFNSSEINVNSEAYHKVLTDGTYTFRELTNKIPAEEGDKASPAGIDLVSPTKASTSDTNFIFTNKWKAYITTTDEDGKAIITELKDDSGKEVIFDFSVEDDNNFKYKPTQDLKLQPIYTPETRLYSIKFYSHDATLYKEVKYTFDQVMSQNNETPLYLNREDDNGLDTEYHRYTFKGWISEKEFLNLDKIPYPTIIDLEKRHVTFETSYYPYFDQEDARLKVSDLKYFETVVKSNLEFEKVLINKYGVSEGTEKIVFKDKDGAQLYGLKLKDIYKDQLSGKITLPNRDSNGNVFTFIEDLSGDNISEIYFLEGNNYVAFNSGACLLMSGLKKVYFPKDNQNLKYLGAQAFKQSGFTPENTFSKSFTIENLPNSITYIGEQCFRTSGVVLDALPNSLEYLGPDAFRYCQNVTFSKIPLGVTTLLGGTFAWCENITINHFGREKTSDVLGAEENNISIIAPIAMESSANVICGSRVTEIVIGNSVEYIGEYAFNNFGSVSGLTVDDDSGKINDDNVITIFGRSVDRV